MASAAATAATARATNSAARTCSVRASASAPTGSFACHPDLLTGRPAKASAPQASATESPVVKTPRRGVSRRPTPRRGAPTASREKGPGGGAAGPMAGPSRRPLASPVGRRRARRWAPRLSRRIARAVVVRAAPEMGRTSWRAEAAAAVEGCTSGTRDRDKVDAADSAAGRGGDQPAGAERVDHSGLGRMVDPLKDSEERQRAPEGGSAVASSRCCHRRADAHAQGREGRRENRGRPNRRGVALAAVVGRSRRGLHVGGRDREGSTVCAG